MSMNDEATYICESCGEEIVVPIDPSAGSSQEYVEDCPVCCNPNIVRVEIDVDGDARVSGAAEQDRF
jgi:DNA replicative helicase MCM subunit Mcm2 (Cdc46/Mcm family)